MTKGNKEKKDEKERKRERKGEKRREKDVHNQLLSICIQFSKRKTKYRASQKK